MPRSVLSSVGVLLAAVLYLCQMVVFDDWLAGARLDLTADRIYTLEEGSRSIAAGLVEPIQVTLYYSETLGREIPFLPPHARRVEQLLREYARASEGKLVLRVVDPEPFTEAEDDAVAAGLGAVPINADGDRVYLGLVATNAVGETEVIPFFYPERDGFLEFDVSSFLAKLDVLERPKLGVVSSLALRGEPPAGYPGAPAPAPRWTILDLLEDGYELVFLEPGFERVPEDCAALLMLHPQDLSDASLYAVDQFVLSGKGAVVCVDPLSEAQPMPPGMNDPFAAMSVDRSSSLAPLLAAWGVDFDPAQVVGDIDHALQVRGGTPGDPRAVDYVAWMNVGAEGIAAQEPVVAELSELTLASPGRLRPSADASTRFTPLLSTGPRASLLGSTLISMGAGPESLLRNYQPGDERLTLAARVDGPAVSAFKDGPPQAADATPHLASSRGEIHLVVVADSDMFDDRFWVAMAMGMFPTVVADNGSFLANALDALAGNTALLDIRGGESVVRRLDVMDELRRDAERLYLQKMEDLQRELAATDARLLELQRQREDGSSLFMTAEQEAEWLAAEETQQDTRKQLRGTRAALREDIEALQARVRALNILAVPLLVLAIFGLRALLRRRRAEASA